MIIESTLKKYLPAYTGENYHEVSKSKHILFKKNFISEKLNRK